MEETGVPCLSRERVPANNKVGENSKQELIKLILNHLDFCARNRAIFKQKLNQTSDSTAYQYMLSGFTITSELLKGTLVLNELCSDSLYLARELEVELRIYEGGILRLLIDEKTVKGNRFRLSKHDLGSIVNPELRLINLRESLTEESDEQATFIVTEGEEKYTFQVQANPFRIFHYVNDILVAIVNEHDTL